MKKYLFLFSFLCMGSLLSAQVQLTRSGKPVSRIVITEKSEVNQPITADQKIKRGDVSIGGTAAGAGEDGFRLLTQDGALFIQSGGDKGAIYGVVTLLEDYLGVSYYAYECYTLNKETDITVPALDRTETPAFRYRQTFSYGNDDPIYKMWFRLEELGEMFIDNMWVHTFNRILPASQSLWERAS